MNSHRFLATRSRLLLATSAAAEDPGFGISAPEGAIDGGRNEASGNLGGDCTGVVCA